MAYIYLKYLPQHRLTFFFPLVQVALNSAIKTHHISVLLIACARAERIISEEIGELQHYNCVFTALGNLNGKNVMEILGVFNLLPSNNKKSHIQVILAITHLWVPDCQFLYIF